MVVLVTDKKKKKREQLQLNIEWFVRKETKEQGIAKSKKIDKKETREEKGNFGILAGAIQKEYAFTQWMTKKNCNTWIG